MKKTKLAMWLAFSTLAVCLAGPAATSGRAEPPVATVSATNAVPAAVAVPVSHQITGAELKTIMLHMQIRANIPVAQARLILKYLQDNSGR
jgi:hypothetical protein